MAPWARLSAKSAIWHSHQQAQVHDRALFLVGFGLTPLLQHATIFSKNLPLNRRSTSSFPIGSQTLTHKWNRCSIIKPLSMWFWPVHNDFGTKTWHRSCEDLPPYQKIKFLCQPVQIDIYRLTKTHIHTDLQTRRKHYLAAYAGGKSKCVIIIMSTSVHILVRNSNGNIFVYILTNKKVHFPDITCHHDNN